MKKFALIGLMALGTSSMAYAGEIADLYQKMVGSKPSKNNPMEWQANRNKKSGIKEIGLERTRCYGACPAYTVVLKSDGSLRYKGEANVKKIGVRTGKISDWQFERLATFIKESGYMDLKNTYTIGITDSPTAFTTVSTGAKSKVIRNYANSGPAKLWAVEQLIDKMVSEAQWDDEKSKL